MIDGIRFTSEDEAERASNFVGELTKRGKGVRRLLPCIGQKLVYDVPVEGGGKASVEARTCGCHRSSRLAIAPLEGPGKGVELCAGCDRADLMPRFQ